jgi:hypothetical protein
LDLFDVAGSCARRWYVFLPLLLLVGWFSYDIYSSVKPVYYANAVIGLNPPSNKIYNAEPGVPLPRNGLLDVGGADLIANMAAVGLREPSTVDRVVAQGGMADYGSRMFPVPANTAPLPLVMVECTAPNAAAATRTLDLVIAQAGATLRTLQQQAQVPESQMVAPFVVSPPGDPAPGMPSRTRSTVAIFAAGAGLTVVLTVILDVLLVRRKSRKVLGPAEPGEGSKPADSSVDDTKPTQVTTAPEAALEPR